MLYNKGCERAVLAGLCRHGLNAYIDITDIISIDSFFDNKNQLIFKVLENLFSKDQEKIDIPSINAEAFSSGFYDRICKDQIDVEYIRSLFNYPIEYDNIRKQAQTLVKLSFARKAQESHQKACKKLDDITGSESIDEIIKLSEEPFLDLMTTITSEEAVSKIGEDIEGYLEYLEENSGKAVGVHTPFPIFNHVIGDGMRQGVHLIAARLKALKYGSKVYTPNGPVNIEDINVGDIVLHPFKGETEVTAVYDHNNIDLYRVHFRDGDFIDCCEDHLWEVTKRWSTEKIVLSTKEIIEHGYYKNNKCVFDIRLPNPVIFNNQQVDIDPYTLGVLLGDGCFCNKRTAIFTTMDDDILNKVKSFYGDKVKFDYKQKNNKSSDFRINSLKKTLEEMGLWGVKSIDKKIPDIYKYNSIEVRLSILRGLMDTDGTCVLDKRSGNTRCRFNSSSKKLAEDVKEIVESLGGLCSVKKYKTSCNNKTFYSFNCEVRLPNFNPFFLKRKAEMVKPRILGELKRSIRKIEKISKGNARCISLKENDGLFMTTNFVVTHNTGKMQPYTSTVYTPNGPRLMGELKVGDKVLTPFGDYSYVTHLFEQGMRTVYKMKFMDGSEMECGMSHIVEYTTRKGKFYKNAQLRELVDEGIKTRDGHYRFEIRIPKALAFNEKELAIDPYVLGLMLGDKNVFESCEQKDLLVFYNIDKWEDRHIPHDYMFSSIEQRTKLLKGLLDSSGEDGAKIKKFYSNSKVMLDGFIDLTRSLGAYSRIMHRVTSWAKARFDKKTKTLVEVVESKKAICRCIKLSEEHGLYLTDGYTTTHNSTIGKEVAYFSAKNGIPSLYIDTEMSKEDQLNRMLASISKINIRSIEKGLYKKSQSDYKKVLAAAKEISSIPFYHKNVAGRDFSYILSVIKRWLHRHVGFEPDGSTKRHLIVYDYFKLMDQSSLKDAAEYQLMGFQIAALHDFCQKYNTPVLSFVQTNRDGITKDTTDIIAQSDRLGWNAISLSVFKRKTAEEIGVDGPENGNAKIIPLEGRFMDRLDDGDYINMYIDGSTATIKEVSTKRRPKLDTGFEINDQREQDTELQDRIYFNEPGDN